eukprot:CAMPEP_0181184942 /NCGR_PEP_ID=MMETSP1096-20121128/9241_1 /TAXON_ID=156174 ORGANISM="Chrysochromulina ericina, Strain CCMP281" /NCGR_SAMPLE_ID=MMETSP1096 /ASSEMBLY_ACC=CAM_ASM_000453 /LENGTH=98 /DNA_ID=CAMNT_0023273749 /DNA_START=118 /DNA_END=415 /DNA_ORIENTATION=-
MSCSQVNCSSLVPRSAPTNEARRGARVKEEEESAFGTSAKTSPEQKIRGSTFSCGRMHAADSSAVGGSCVPQLSPCAGSSATSATSGFFPHPAVLAAF